MNSSESIDQLLTALMDMHNEFGVIIAKDSKGHKGTYASLPAILESIHNRCKKYGLMLTQGSKVIDNQPAIVSTLWHPKSKQWISCESLLTPSENNLSADQAWGGSSTYHRRYDAMMLLGMFSEDDPTDHDGNYEAKKTNTNQSYGSYQNRSSNANVVGVISNEQLDQLVTEIQKLPQEMRSPTVAQIASFNKIRVLSELKQDQFEGVMRALRSKLK
jgi:hypothetical protein